MQITKGRQNLPYKTVIYGPEGIGKTTFAAQFPDPLFIDTEGSTARMDVARLPKPSSSTHLKEMINYVIQNKPCKTLVIDTADWAERLLADDLLVRWKVDGIEKVDGGYGKGYTYLGEDFGRMLNKLTEVVDAGINVVITAHAWIRPFSPPDETTSYDRWELKLQKKCAPLLKEWADMILFVNYDVFVVTTKDKKGKGQGGKRIMHTTHNPAWDAKNRDGLPEELPFEFSQIAHLFQTDPSYTTRSMAVEVPTAPAQAPVVPELVPDPTVSVTQQEATALQYAEYDAWLKAQNTVVPELEAYPAALPGKVADLLRPMNATASNLMMAIGPTTTGGLGFWPADMTLDNIPAEFWDYVVAEGWSTMIQPKIAEILMEIPY